MQTTTQPQSKDPAPVFSNQKGNSLLELLISLTFISILIAIAAPSFATLISKSEVATQASALHQSLHLARSAALTRQQRIHICQIDKGSEICSADYSSNRSWANGWIIFADQNDNNELDGSDEVIRKVVLNTTNSIVFNQRGRLRFFADGSARSAGFYICDKLNQSFRHVYLLHSGRARITTKLQGRNQEQCKSSLS